MLEILLSWFRYFPSFISRSICHYKGPFLPVFENLPFRVILPRVTHSSLGCLRVLKVLRVCKFFQKDLPKTTLFESMEVVKPLVLQ